MAERLRRSESRAATAVLAAGLALSLMSCSNNSQTSNPAANAANGQLELDMSQFIYTPSGNMKAVVNTNMTIGAGIPKQFDIVAACINESVPIGYTTRPDLLVSAYDPHSLKETLFLYNVTASIKKMSPACTDMEVTQADRADVLSTLVDGLEGIDKPTNISSLSKIQSA
jgi:hypothetical protein